MQTMKIILGFIFVAVLGSAGITLLKSSPEAAPIEDPRFSNRLYNRLETDWNDYSWPTNASNVKTSSFCEFRKTHFHAGIDISTNMKEGYDVYASRAGWLHSVEFEPGGYGWFLVLKHYDGYYTCYAHLQGFPEWIERAYIDKLGEMKKSFGYTEWGQEAFKVKKGDVVAYTGATGAGPPHLHFEIRDRNFNPVNPGLAPALRVADSFSPEMKQIAFVPLDARSTVNGKSAAAVFTLQRIADTLYRLQSTPVLSGRIGVQLYAIDGAEGFQDFETPYSMTAFLNGRKHFDVAFDRIQDDHGWFIRLDRNNDLMLKQKGEFRKLYKEPGNTLAVYLPDEPWAGILSGETALPGLNAYSVTASDPSGNAATVHCTFALRPVADLSVSPSSTNSIAIGCKTGARGIFVECAPMKGKALPVKRWTAAEARNSINWPLPDPDAIYEIRTVDSAGNTLQRVFSSRRLSNDAELTCSYRVFGGDIAVDIQSSMPFNVPPVVSLKGRTGSVYVPVEGLTPDRYMAVLTVPPDVQPPFVVEVKGLAGGKIIEWRRPVHETYISPEAGGELVSGDGACRATFERGSVLQGGFYSLSKRSDSQVTAYVIQPSDVPLTGNISVRVKPPWRHDGKNFIRALCPSIGIRYGTQKFDSQSPWVTGIFGRYPAEYRIVRDTVSPLVVINPTRSRLPLIRITDDGSGVNPQSILVRSGRSILPLFYNERMSGYEIPAQYLKKHKISSIVVTVSDRVGNFCIRESHI